MGSSTGNLPLYTKVSPIKLKLSAIEGLTNLRPLIKKSDEISLSIMNFWVPQNTTFWPIKAIFMIFHHFEASIFPYNCKQ